MRNLTMQMPSVPEALRGTYAGLGHPATVEHLCSLGITAVELLPVQAFTTEPQLQRRGLRNHWGYNTLGYFAPHAPYAAATEPQAVVDELKRMVQALHAAGIEVFLDVVYNHTCEQSFTGPDPVLAGPGQPHVLPARRARRGHRRHRLRQHARRA